MPLPQGLSVRERQMVDALVDACRQLNDVFWRQSDREGLQLYKTTSDPTLKTLLGIMGSRWDLLNENRPFVGNTPMPPGHDYYPHDLTRDAVEAYVKQHPAEKDAIYSSFTVVKREGGRLKAVPYHVEYKPFVDAMASDLRKAAALSEDASFANFLRLRADSLQSDDYYKSDLAWLDLKDPKFDVIFAPYETYTDDLLGVKASYGASILIRNEVESHKLAVYQKYVPEIQDALPIEAQGRPSKHGHLTPMEVMDAPYRAGDLRYGYQAVADNLPNDPRVHQQKGSKKIFFKNFMDARVTYVILPVARKLMAADQAAKVSGEGYLYGTLMHEISHELGPNFAHLRGRELSINEAIGPAYSGLEEAKADVVGMFGLGWLMEHGAMPKERAEEYYASYVAGILRTLRFGVGEAHGRAEMMEFNYLAEQGALGKGRDGLYRIVYGKMPAALKALAHELLVQEDTGDRARVEGWFKKYDVMPDELKEAMGKTSDIPVDIYPRFSFPDQVQ
ncbi:MAG TPA: Zn-dependent hydrolase [Bryobacteraceae bacterium]